LLEFKEKGLYCTQGDFYIDPWLPVPKAIITHAHSDHAKWGCKHYLSHYLSEPILRLRLGADISLQTLEYSEEIIINGVKVSLHPAGHIIGSAQVRLEYKGEIWVVSGDYKVEPDNISTPFEAVRCHTFITECTFGLPVFNWQAQDKVMDDVHTWWRKNKNEGKTSVLFGYPLGKTQRLLKNLDSEYGPILAHGAVWNVNEAFRNIDIDLPSIELITRETHPGKFDGAMILAPPSALGSLWMRRYKSAETAMVSGWMNLRGAKRRRPVDKGFVLSDHADWKGLLQAIKETGATKILATHGYKASFAKYLTEQGYDAYEVETLWEGEGLEEKEPEIIDPTNEPEK
jgi:putative mRNA 3-end processing factor